jgi:pectate lyase
MRFGNAHVYDVFVDNSAIVEGTNMATASTCDAAVFAENNYYLEVTDPFPAQSGTSPPGRVAQAGCKWILHGADTSLVENSFLRDPATWTWNTRPFL